MPTTGVTIDAREEIIRRNGWALGVLATALGAVIVCSTGARWSAQIWQDALRVPGAPPSWGFVMLTGGILLLYGLIRHSRLVYHWGCCIAFTWCIVVTGVQLYTFLGDLHDLHVWWPTSPMTIVLAMISLPGIVATWLVRLFYDVIHNGGGTTNPMGIVIWGYVGYMYALRFKLSGKASYE